MVKSVFSTSRYVVTIEEQNIIGGLGGAFAEVCSSMEKHGVLLRFGISDAFTNKVGNTTFLRNYYGINHENVCKRILETIEGL